MYKHLLQMKSCIVSDSELLSELVSFFAVRYNFDVLRVANSSSAPVSLRALSWYVSQGIDDPILCNDYNDQIRKYTRRMFDPFRRNSRIQVVCEDDVIVSTLGQMNFFKWTISSGVWNTVQLHYADIQTRVRSAVPKRRSISTTARAKCTEQTTGARFVEGQLLVMFD